MLFEPLFAHAQSKPQEVAITDDTGQYTWRQVATMSAGLGMFLGMQTEKDKVGLLLPAGAGFFVSFFGSLLAGKTAVPINFLLGEKETGHIIKDSGIDTVLTIPILAGKLKDSGLNVVDLTQLPKEPPVKIEPKFPNPKAEDLAVLLYTSGTSGLPKGVMLTYGNLHEDVKSCIDHVQLKATYKFLGLVPLFHSTGLLATLIAPTYLGSAIHYIGRFSPVATVKAIREQNCSVVVGVPSMYGAMLRLKEASPDDFKHVFACITGGEPLPEVIRETFWQKYHTHLFEGYGLTETIGPVCVNTPEHHKPGSVGKLIPKAEVRIVDPDNGNTQPKGKSGEIWIKGPMVMKGYYNLPEDTDRVLTKDGFFKTGDLGMIDDEGYLHVTGRLKDLIIVSGEKVVPREVEEAIQKHPAVGEAAVIGRKDPSRGEAVVAFIVLREGQQLTENELRDFLRDQGMINWKIPKDVKIVPDLPRSPTGKVLKRVLGEQLKAG